MNYGCCLIFISLHSNRLLPTQEPGRITSHRQGLYSVPLRCPEAKELKMKEMNSLSVTAALPEKKYKLQTSITGRR